jgi:hypothetical protein
LRKINCSGKVVHELGAGVALPSLVASKYAARTIISDYISSLVSNIRYNIALNCVKDEETNVDDLNDEEQNEIQNRRAEIDSSSNAQEISSAQPHDQQQQTQKPQTSSKSSRQDNATKTANYSLYSRSEFIKREREKGNTKASATAVKLDWIDFHKRYNALSDEEKETYGRNVDIILGSEISYDQNKHTLGKNLILVFNSCFA